MRAADKRTKEKKSVLFRQGAVLLGQGPRIDGPLMQCAGAGKAHGDPFSAGKKNSPCSFSSTRALNSMCAQLICWPDDFIASRVSRKRKHNLGLSSNKFKEKGHRRSPASHQFCVSAVDGCRGFFVVENTCAPCVDSFITSWMGQQ
jgi:hypothetical protein